MKRPNKKILIRYFLGECSDEEEKIIEIYLAADMDKRYIEDCLKEAFRLQSDNVGIDIWASRDRIRSKIAEEQKQCPKITLKFYPIRKWVSYAAAVLLFFAAGALYLIKGRRTISNRAVVSWTMITGLPREAKTITLADSSKVTLFPGSSIAVPSDYNYRNRSVKLDGRAFFSVVHNKQKPFYVSAKELTTRVLGTSFEIDVTPTENIITLRTGKVDIMHSGKEIALLSPNQQLHYETATGQYHIDTVKADRLVDWMHGEFNYDGMPLRHVLDDIRQWYGIKINVEDSILLNRKIVVVFNFKDQTLNRILSLLSESGLFNYEINQYSVTIKNK